MKPDKRYQRNGVSIRKIASEFGLRVATAQSWKQAGMPTTDLKAAKQWIIENRPEQLPEYKENKVSDESLWTKADWDRHEKQLKCAKLKHEIDVSRGKVHDREECVRSLCSMRAAESRVLHGLGDRLAAMFPAVGLALKEACDQQVDEVLKRLHDGDAYGA